MTESIWHILASFAAGLTGAAVGGLLLWRYMRAQLEAMIASRLPGVASTPAEAIQAIKDVGITVVASIEAAFATGDEVRAARMNSALQTVPAASQETPPWVRDVVRAELAFHAEQWREREHAASRAMETWRSAETRLQRERDVLRDKHLDERRATDLEVVVEAIEALTALRREAGARTSRPVVAVPPVPFPPFPPHALLVSPSPVSGGTRKSPAPNAARPPEMGLTPLPRPETNWEPQTPERELTDEELDAMPADLPAASPLRKRLKAAPAKPPLRQI